MAIRQFPFTPRSARQLEVGDLVPLRSRSGEWRCLQVTELRLTGPGSLKYLMIGVLPWLDTQPPTVCDVEGLSVVVQALTRIEIFTEGGLEVIGHAPLLPHGLPARSETYVGKIDHVWGWKATLTAPEEWWPLDPNYEHLADLKRPFASVTPNGYDPHELVRFVLATTSYPADARDLWADRALDWIEQGLSVAPIADDLAAFVADTSSRRPGYVVVQRAARLLRNGGTARTRG